jgi:polyisoprenoid-binding protein YceI
MKGLIAVPTSVTTLRAPPAGRYIIDSSTSTVTFVTKHMVGVGRVRGRFAVVRGAVVVADRVEDSAADAEISASSFSTRNFLSDGQARSPLLLNAGRRLTPRSAPTAPNVMDTAGWQRGPLP